MPRLVRRMPPVGPLRSAGIAPLRRYYGPVRQALVFAALRLSARTATLLPRVFSAGRGALPCFHPCPCVRAAALYPAERRAPQIGFGSACCLRRNCGGSAFGSSVDEASSGRSRIVAARTLAHPAERGFVGGLRRRDLPRRRHPSYAASICYRFRTFTLRIHGYLQASLNYDLPAADLIVAAQTSASHQCAASARGPPEGRFQSAATMWAWRHHRPGISLLPQNRDECSVRVPNLALLRLEHTAV